VIDWVVIRHTTRVRPHQLHFRRPILFLFFLLFFLLFRHAYYICIPYFLPDQLRKFDGVNPFPFHLYLVLVVPFQTCCFHPCKWIGIIYIYIYIYIIFIISISLIKTIYVYIHTQHVDIYIYIYILLPGTLTAIFMALVRGSCPAIIQKKDFCPSMDTLSTTICCRERISIRKRFLSF
jgi:hypothetical protein